MADSNHRDALMEEIEEQASLYALGALPAEEAARFELRLQAGCPICTHEVRECDRAVKALALSAPEATPPASARDRLLDAIGDGKRPAGVVTMGPGTLVRADSTPWIQTPIPGVEIRNLYKEKAMLVRMAPKSWLAAHEHDKAEQCLVLEGSISSDGLTAYAGDFTYMPAGSEHHPLYSETGCLLLIAYA
jgi:anti-sigma factor ChrR (cupin superfamily)